MWSPKTPIRKKRLQILNNKVISFIVIILIKPKRERKRENATSITFFIILLQQILNSKLLQTIIDCKKLILVVGSN